jgi:hypothetical protein
MYKRWTMVLITLLVLVAAVWASGRWLWKVLLAMHGH